MQNNSVKANKEEKTIYSSCIKRKGKAGGTPIRPVKTRILSLPSSSSTGGGKRRYRQL